MSNKVRSCLSKNVFLDNLKIQEKSSYFYAPRIFIKFFFPAFPQKHFRIKCCFFIVLLKKTANLMIIFQPFLRSRLVQVIWHTPWYWLDIWIFLWYNEITSRECSSMVRAPPCHGGSCGFESRHSRFDFLFYSNASQRRVFWLTEDLYHKKR